jgi:hypothetical protein
MQFHNIGLFFRNVSCSRSDAGRHPMLITPCKRSATRGTEDSAPATRSGPVELLLVALRYCLRPVRPFRPDRAFTRLSGNLAKRSHRKVNDRSTGYVCCNTGVAVSTPSCACGLHGVIQIGCLPASQDGW